MIHLVIVDGDGKPFAFFNVDAVPRVGEEIDVDARATGVDPFPRDVRPVLRVVHVPAEDAVRVVVGPAPASPEETAANLAALRKASTTSPAKKTTPAGDP